VPASAILAACIKLRPQILEGLAPPDLDIVLSAAIQRYFPAKSVIARQGYPANHLFLLTKGRARFSFTTQAGKKIILLWLAPGQILGAAALLSKPSLYLVTSEAVEASSVLAWDRATIRGLAKRYPQLLENAISTASEYLTWYCAAHAALTTQSAQQRLSQAILCLAPVIGREVPDGVELDVINEELASAANITRFTTSRLLNKWQRSGVITKRRGKILLRSMNCLLPPNP
jgi:CRP/FNR family transcriptional regulator, nitrogen oxide reductase regulator